MAKKKFKKNRAIIAATLAVLLAGGAFGGLQFYRSSLRPAQYKAEGRKLMLAGNYDEAYQRFGRVASRLQTDTEFLGWMYETSLHRTSFNDTALRDSSRLVEAMLATKPGDTQIILRKLKFDLDLLDAGGLEQFSSEQAKRLHDLSAKVLASDAQNAIALRADAMAAALPVFKQDTSITSSDIEAVLTDLRTRLDASPDNPDLLALYALGVARDRDVLLRERAIDQSATDPRVKAMFADLDARNLSLLKSADDESKPAEVRAMAYARASRIDSVIAGSGFVGDQATAVRVGERRIKSQATAATLVPPESDLYVPLRVEQANNLARVEKIDEAEKLLRETIEGASLQWTPRLALADILSDHARPQEALKLLDADLKPSDALTGLEGYQFLFERRQIPMRRAFVRLQTIDSVKPEERAGVISASQADYDLALADNKVTETDPSAMQVKAALQEVRLDRTGAVQTLNRALESGPNDRLRMKLQQQLVTLNLRLNQPGAASAILEQMLHNPSLTPQTQLAVVLQLIDLRIRNGETEQARLLLDQAKRVLPGNPALLALEIQLTTDPKQKLLGLAKLPEDNPEQRAFKMKFAAQNNDEPTVRRLAEQALKDEPGALDVSLMYGDFLRQNKHVDEAVKIFQGALAAHPDNKTLALLIQDTQAVTPEQKEQVLGTVYADPYKRAMFDADRLRSGGKVDEYVAKLEVAEKIDKDHDGTATERLALYYTATGDAEKASKAADRLAALQRDPASIRVLRIRIAMAGNKMSEASAQADALTSELPGFAPGWIVKAETLEAANQYSQAIDAFQTALTARPDSVEALRGLVDAAERAGRLDVLKRYIDTGLRVTQNNDDFFVEASLRYDQAHGDPSSTIAPRLKRRDAAPDDPNRWFQLAEAYLVSADAKDHAGDRVAGTDYRAKALEVLSTGATKFPKVWAFMLESANLVAKAGDVASAVKSVDAMQADGVELEPALQAARAKFYSANGQPQKAINLLAAQVSAGKADDATRLQLAQLQGAQRDVDGALKSLEGAADSPSVREARLNLFFSANRLDDAKKMSAASLASERSAPNLLMAALVEARQGHVPEAMKFADEAVALNGENGVARFNRARIMLLEKPLRNNDLISDLQVVRKNQPLNVDARLLLAERLRAGGRGPEATTELEALSRDFSDDRRVTIELVKAYANETPPRYGRIDQALAEAKKGGGAADAQLLSLESQIALQRGDNAHAVEAARAAVVAAPEDIGLYRTLLSTMVSAGAYDEVVASVDRIEKQNSSLYWTYMLRGTALHRLKRDDEAGKQFDRAIGLAQALKESESAVFDVTNAYAAEFGADQGATWIGAKLPDETATRLTQMRVLIAGKKLDKAIAVGEAVLVQLGTLPQPTQIQVLSTLGTAYLSTQPPQADKAREIYTRLDAMQPNNMMTLNNLAYAMTLSGSGPSMQEAVEIARKANELAQQETTPNPYIMDTYGWTLVQAGKVDDGLTVLRQALEAGSLPETFYHMGEAYVAQGQKDAAMQSLNTALAKVNAVKQSGGAVDTSLAAHIDDAIRRAQTIATP